MRIDAYNQISQIYSTTKAKKSVQAYQAAGAGSTDELHISQLGRDYQIAKQAVAKAPDIREEKVAQVKAQIENNNYNVSAGDFASRLLEKYKATYC